MAQHSHVPKFGNWDTDNVPYSAYFENARKEKARFMMNPNDPEAFNLCMRDGENIDADGLKASPHVHSYTASSVEKRGHRRRASQGSFTIESTSERSNSDYYVIRGHVKSDHKKSMSKGGSAITSFFSSCHNRHKSGSHSSNDFANQEATLIPKFGDWDVTDPKSGEGYTVIFSKMKQEKQIASGHVPSKNSPLHNYSNIQNQCGRPSSVLYKYCCCLFSSESK